MYLSGLELCGFKSFPTRTRLTFNPGVMAIVGPNGCGKTNTVDAVRWVLGEQRAGILRSDKMENVIFAGTSKRKPSSFADVTIIIENRHGVLPAEYSEVSVTRRLHRSGESEYLINRRPCRLKDIRNLFADTGLGPESYSIIELSMVEGILSGRPEERRRLFEEAAGVTLYKSQLKTARSRLFATEADLIRLTDLFSEIETQRNSLKRQVAKAKRYRFLSEALRVKELTAAKEEIADLRLRLTPLEERIGEDRKAKTTLEVEISSSETQIEKLRSRLAEYENSLSAFSGRRNEMDGRLQASRREVAMLEERIRSSNQRSTERDQEELDLVERRKSIASDIQALDREHEKSTAQRDEVQNKVNSIESAWREYDRRYQQKREQRRTLEQCVYDAERTLNRNQNAVEVIQSRISENEKRLSRVTLESEHTETPPDPEPLRENVERYEDELEELESQLEKARTRREEIRENRTLAKAKLDRTQQELTAVRKRVDMLEGIVKGGKGRPKAVRAILDSGFSGLLGRLGDAVQVDKKWAPAVGAALDDTVSAVAVETPDTFRKAAEFLISGKHGRGLLLLTRDETDKAGASPSFADVSGSIGPLVDTIKVSGKAGKAVLSILSRTWIMQDLESLLDNAESALREQWSLVTPEGCFLSSNGILSIGTVDHEDLGAQHLLDEAVGETKEVEKALAEAKTQLDALIEEEQDAQNQPTHLEGQRRETISRLEEARRMASRADANWQAYDTLKARAQSEIQQLRREIEELRTEAETKRNSVESVQRVYDQSRKDLETFLSGFEAVEEEGKSLGEARDRLQKELVEASSEKERIQGQVRSMGALMEEITQRIHQLLGERSSSITALEDATDRLRRVKAEAAVIDSELKEVQAETEQVRNQYESSRKAFSEKESFLSSKRNELSTVRDRMHSNELKVSELSNRLQTVRSKIEEEYQFDLLAGPQVELPLAVDEENSYMEKTLGEIREALQTIGPVNQMAVEEFEVIDRRWHSIKKEHDDLSAAKATLEDTIHEINAVARRRFLETFSRVEGNFISLFSRLFGGGVASLSLGDGDPLEAGIKIYASPKGKKLAAIDLLSGGEKAMTAIALLFALYLEKPAPFCFLDEVDAPLDDVNVKRFTNLLREFTDRTQFLVVTHNKLTMEQADRLYGVTMEEEGVSKLVAVEIAGRSTEGVEV